MAPTSGLGSYEPRSGSKLLHSGKNVRSSNFEHQSGNARGVINQANNPHASTRSLDFGRLETRFLLLKSLPFSVIAKPAEIIKFSCKLEIKSLFECPQYTALSYSWGDHGSTLPILLNERIVQVTASLKKALEELVARGVKVVWVDALCIDQKNDYEKVYQLRQMGTIFSKAAKVIAWLGPAADDSDKAMYDLSGARGIEVEDRQWLAIVKLLERPYWERVWIIQELAKASIVEVWCGSQTLTWDAFTKGLSLWWPASQQHNSYISHPILTLKYFRVAEQNSRGGAARMLLSTAMVRTIQAKATLPRDKIYALLGITRDSAEVVPTPNYVQNDATVFEDIMRHMIVEQGQLELICFAGLSITPRSSPTWIPSWGDRQALQLSPWVSPWLAKVFDNIKPHKCVSEAVKGVLKVDVSMLGRLQNESVIWMGTPSWQNAMLLIWDIASHLKICGGFTAKSPETLPTHNYVYALAAFWIFRSTLTNFHPAYPKLGELYAIKSDVSLAGVTLGDCIEVLGRVPEVVDVQSILKAPSTLKALEQLETSRSVMIDHGLDFAVLNNFSQSRIVIVPTMVQDGTYVVVRIRCCSLPKVLRLAYDNRYELVGGVVESLDQDNDPGALRALGGIHFTPKSDPDKIRKGAVPWGNGWEEIREEGVPRAISLDRRRWLGPSRSLFWETTDLV